MKPSKLLLMIMMSHISLVSAMKNTGKSAQDQCLRDVSNVQPAAAPLAHQPCTPERPTQPRLGSSMSKMGLTPAGTRTQTLEVVTTDRMLNNIMISEDVNRYLDRVADCDRHHEELLGFWSTKHIAVKNLFRLHSRVFDMLSAVVRARIAAERVRHAGEPGHVAHRTPDKGVLSHAFTVEHMINIFKWGTAYLCVDHDLQWIRLNIVARVRKITYSDSVRSRESLTTHGWATLSFVLHEQFGPQCIHYFVHDQHPEHVKFLDTETGFRYSPYFMYPIMIGLAINPYSKQMNVFFQDPNEYEVISAILRQRVEQQWAERELAAMYITPQRNRKN